MKSGLVLTTWTVDSNGANVPAITLAYNVWFADYTGNYPPDPTQLVICIACDDVTAIQILANEVVLTTTEQGDPTLFTVGEDENWQQAVDTWLN